MVEMRSLRRAAGAAVLGLMAGSGAAAQEPVEVTVRVHAEGAPVGDADVRIDSVRAVTGADGFARLRVEPGVRALEVTRIGFSAHERTVAITRDTTIDVELEADAVEEEAIIVVSTRGERRIEDEPVRVEVLAREEIEEKMLMTPGSIAMLLNETTGLRVQETSPSLGGATIRIQGLRGRYTQLLADGLPLFGGQAGALGLLQIPPMDLRQVEVIKGAASALYGSSALAGVVNLISRRPDGAHELLVNQTTRGGTDALIWLASAPRDAGWSATVLAGMHTQNRVDVDDDAWTDIPRHRRGSARPRLHWSGAGGNAMLTAGFMREDRRGGGMTPAGDAWSQNLETTRVDAGAVVRHRIGSLFFDGRASAMQTTHDHRFGDVTEHDRHTTLFVETSLRGQHGAHLWAAGTALERNAYRSSDVSGFDYTHEVPSLFAQDEITVSPWLSLSVSARVDAHNEFGTIASPRASLLLRPAGSWTLRLSAGGGYYAPTPFTEETEEVGLSRVVPPTGLGAERARSFSADVGTDVGGVEIHATAFHSNVEHALAVRPSTSAPGRAELVNLAGSTRTSGTELLVRYRREPFGITASHTFVNATEPTLDGARRTVPHTPRHSAGMVAVYEVHGEGRAGLEMYYTGRQPLEDNPYRTTGRPYVIFGLLFEKRFGRVRAFLNLENLTDVRQTRWQPTVLPERGEYGRWTVDTWAPLEGRVFNGGVRVEW